MRPRAVAWRALSAPAPLSLRFPAHDMVAFGQLLEGSVSVERAGIRTFVEAGDFVLLPAPPVWFAHVGEGGVVLDFKEMIEAPPVLEGRPAVRFVAGAFEFAAPNARWLAQFLPPFLHVRGVDVAAGRLGGLLEAIAEEVGADRTGRSLMLDRLLEILLIEAIRSSSGEGAYPRRGLLAGLADARLGSALRALHEAPQSVWTVAKLARVAGMSRSAFAARFAEAVGEPPMDYALDLRMQIAKAALRSSAEPVSRIAALAGYGSVSAFSTAFRRATGAPPSAYPRDPSSAGSVAG